MAVNKKLKEFQKWMKSQKMGLALFFNGDFNSTNANLTYFSGYVGLGVLAITQSKAFLVVPKMEYVSARKQAKVRVYCSKKRLLPEVMKYAKVRPKRVGIDKNKITLNFYLKLKKDLPARYLDVSPKCLELRASKTAEELMVMRKACKITDDIFHRVFMNFKKFKSEYEAAEFLKRQAEEYADGVSFPPIVASGGNGSSPHNIPAKGKFKKGFCVIDYGVKLNGYCSDVTRTIYIGTPTTREVELYHKVLSVQKKSIAQCVVGADFSKIDMFAREEFGKLGPHFTHLIGHGLGRDVHENPNPKKTVRRPITKLVEGSVITIEPGLYYDGKLGIRIEDDVLITKTGPKVLTKVGKNLLVIKK